MAKRKLSRPSVKIDTVRWGAVVVVVVVSVFLAFQAMSAFLRGSATFLVKDLVIASDLGDLSLSDLEKLKGKNIFSIDIRSVEDKIRAKYPRVGGLKVLRRFPDAIELVGYQREALFLASIGAQVFSVGRDGFLIGQATGDQIKAMTRVKGLKALKAQSGQPLDGERWKDALHFIEVVGHEEVLSSVGLASLDITDAERIVCVFGVGKTVFEVYMSQQHADDQIHDLAGILTREGLDINGIKYIDLRFGEPVIGRKKG